jgi:glycosyltransferase involved in cell wall biosynthesis
MRIGIMLRAFEERGGVGVYTRNITRELLKRAPHHDFFLYFGREQDLGTYSEFPNATERFVPLGNKVIWDQVRMPQWFRRDRLDAIFHPKFTVPLLCGRKSVMVLHGAGWFIPETRRFWSRTTRLYARLMMPVYCWRAGTVLSVSEITRQEFCRRLGVPESKIRTVYFAPGEQFAQSEDRERTTQVLEKFGVEPGFILTLTGGDRADRKNFGTILDAFRLVHEQQPCKLVVAGRGCEDFRQRYKIPDSGYGADIIFTGWVDQQDLPALYRSASLFLYPSNMEAFPIPITEALASGSPIVTSNAYGLKELAGDAALLVDPSAPGEVANAVKRILQDEKLRSDLRQRAMRRSEAFDWGRCCEKTLEALEGLAAS